MSRSMQMKASINQNEKMGKEGTDSYSEAYTVVDLVTMTLPRRRRSRSRGRFSLDARHLETMRRGNLEENGLCNCRFGYTHAHTPAKTDH